MTSLQIHNAVTRHPGARTAWFAAPAEIPSRMGYYERCYACGTTVDYWDGQHWHVGADQGPTSRRQDLPWRGLATDPWA
jgi:hypothetical protein